ncbi:MAG: 6-phospho-alpha-glucosidase [Bacillota bacterium]|nr:6-phospho-alpha-glucosidase [Bacillota bacterium]
MKAFKVVIVGGGSSHTPGIIDSLIANLDRFPLKKLVLYDIDQDRLDLVEKLCSSLIAKLGTDCEFFTTTSPEKAYTDIDFVFAQVRQGGLKMREQDEKICLRHGVVGQETCGPGGMAYGLRSIPAVFKIIDDVRTYAPEAWIINYSNPAAIVAEATRRKYNNYKILNICDMPVAIQLSFSKMLNLEKYNDLEPTYFGLNHFGWWTHLYDKEGNDRMPELKEKILQFGLAASHDKHHSDPSWAHTWQNFKEILTDYPDFLPNTYLQYYLYSKDCMEDMDPNYTRANMVMDGREKEMYDQVKKLDENENFEVNLNLFNAFGDFIVDVAESIAFNKKEKLLVIVENNGSIPQLPNDAMVEVPCYVRAWGPEATVIGPIPTFHLGMLQQQLASEKLLVDAYFENSYQKVLEAFTMNKTVPSGKIAREILDEMIIANKGYWPELK